MRQLSALGLIGGTALGLMGCSADLALFKADSNWWSLSSPAVNTPPLSRSASAESLIGPGGSCPAPAGDAPRGVGLGMTECEVLTALGPTPAMEIAANERSERSVVLTYAEGEHAGIYRFAAGLLVSIERLPEEARAKPAKKPLPRRATTAPRSAAAPPSTAVPPPRNAPVQLSR